ncbi:MAG: tetratricopeptide repeat protein [Pseudomonadota bacterium]
MSLLMQALKKAESAKQKQAEATDAKPVAELPARTQEHETLSLQPQEPSRHDAAPVAAAQANSMPGNVAESPPPTKIEPVDYFSSDLRPPPASFIPTNVQQQGFDSDLGFPAASRNLPPAPPVDAAADMRQEPKPESRPADQNSSTGTPPKLKIGNEQQQAAAKKASDARNSAKSMFASKKPTRSRRPMIIAVVGLLLLMAAVGYGYFQFLGIAQAPLTTAIPPAPIVPEPTIETESVPTVIASAEPSVATKLSTTEDMLVPATASLPLAVPKQVSPRPAPTTVTTAPQTAAVQPTPTSASGRQSPVAEPQMTTMEAESQAIRIERSKASQQTNPTLNAAYQSFVFGDIHSAQTQYQRVLQQEPDNRDALLGIAAIALNRGQTAQAGSFYTRLLELDPADADAAAGLASVQQGDVNRTESALKKVLTQNPQSGSALFALGNTYAQQSRWADAQQAYFRAFGVTPESADYAFNLAVSLDKLNQNKLALDYYQRSLQLAKQGGANINKETVKNRIRELQSAVGSAAE